MNLLDGIKVIDLTVWAFCPSAGAILASWGADVIHVEHSLAPDPMRVFGGASAEPGGASWMFKHYNRGKRAIALDLSKDEGREVLLKLAEDADVFLTSYLPRTRAKLGVDVEDVRARNPKIIYARGSGQGPKGPESGRGGYDGATWWMRGSLAQSTMDVSGATFPTGMVGHGDGMSGMVFAGGICAALLKRERSGETPIVDASLMGTAMWFNAPAIISSKAVPDAPFGGPMPPRESGHPSINSTYKTSDGRYIHTLMLGDSDAEWADFVQHLGRPDLATDPKFATSAGRMQNNSEGIAILDAVFAEKTLEEWKKILVTTKMVWAPVQTPREMHDDVQTHANRFVQEVTYPDGSTLPLVAPPVLFDEDPGDIPRSPEYGEHTTDVMTELGYSAEVIDDLRARKVVL